MRRVKNPFCLDPKETSCPRLAKIGMEWNPSTGTLQLTPNTIDIKEAIRTHTTLTEPTSRGFIPSKSEIKTDRTLSTPDRLKEDVSYEDDWRVMSIYDPDTAVAVDKLRRAKELDIEDEYMDYLNGLSSIEPETGGLEKVGSLGNTLNIYEGDNKLIFSFHGAIAGSKDENLKWNVLMGQDKYIQNSDSFNEIRKTIEDYIDEYPLDKLEFIGYSLGGYKARFFAGLFGGDAHLFNAHIMPFSVFPKMTGKANFHTIISDQTSFKYWLPYWNGEITTERDSSNETHTLYNPKTGIDPINPNPEEFIREGHDLAHLRSGGERFTPDRYNIGSGALGLVGLGFGVADIVYEAEGDRGSTARGIETSGAVVGEIQTGIDAPQMSFIEGSASDITYFMDRFGFTDFLKSDERKRQEAEMAMTPSQRIQKRFEEDPDKTDLGTIGQEVTEDTGTSFVMGGKTYVEVP